MKVEEVQKTRMKTACSIEMESGHVRSGGCLGVGGMSSLLSCRGYVYWQLLLNTLFTSTARALSTYHTTLRKTSQMSATVTERKVDHAAVEMLEEPFIRVRPLPLTVAMTASANVSFPCHKQIPYELMRRNHRAAQRQVEKDFTFLQVC
jgi:hypothetical protein